MVTQIPKVKILLDLMERIESYPPVVKLIEENTTSTLYLTDDDLLPGDVEFAGMIERWEYLADLYLIREDGSPDMERLAFFERFGYKVGPGEKDSFGWVTGKIRKGGLAYIFG